MKKRKAASGAQKQGASRRGAKRIPEFGSDEEEARFWETHDLSDYWNDVEPATDVYFERPKKQMVTLRLDRPLIQRIKATAIKKGIPYSTLIRMWLVERVEKMP